MSLIVRNPHSVLAALQTRPQDVLKVTLPRAAQQQEGWARVLNLARQKKVPIQEGAPARMHDKRDRHGLPGLDSAGGRESIAEATLREREGIPVEGLFKGATEKAGGRGLWLALDSLQDPHNVGAIFRTAAFFGVQGILLTQERSAPLSGTVYDVASGGVEHVPFTLQTNLQRGFEAAKEAGLWILGSSEHAHDDIRKIERDRPWLLVLGNEEKGMRRLTQESCDVLCRIPPQGEVTSLNVSVAAGIMISRLSC